MAIYVRRLLHFLLIAAVFAAMAAASPYARAEESPLATDKAAVEACLALAQKNQQARPQRDELTQKTAPRDWLNAVREEAPARTESCIGAVAAACIEAEGNQSTAAMNNCYGRETAVWDARLNAAYKKALADGEADAAEGFRKTQRAWIAFRDASCAQAWLVYKGTMASPMGAYCTMEMTARQAIWLEQWGQ